MMSHKTGAAGNPASHRMGNPKLQARRERSWARAQVKKIEHAKENAARAAANKALREQGLPTPHEEKQAKRKEARDILRLAGLLPPIGVDRVTWERNGRTNVGGQS